MKIDYYDVSQAEAFIRKHIQIGESIESEILEFLSVNWYLSYTQKQIVKMTGKKSSLVIEALASLVKQGFIFYNKSRSGSEDYSINVLFAPVFLVHLCSNPEKYDDLLDSEEIGLMIYWRHTDPRLVIEDLFEASDGFSDFISFLIDEENVIYEMGGSYAQDFFLVYKLINNKASWPLLKKGEMFLFHNVFLNAVYYPACMGLNYEVALSYFEEEVFPKKRINNLFLLRYVEVLFLRGEFQKMLEFSKKDSILELLVRCFATFLGLIEGNPLALIKEVKANTEFLTLASNVIDSVLIMHWCFTPGASGYKSVLKATGRGDAIRYYVLSSLGVLENASENAASSCLARLPKLEKNALTNGVVEHNDDTGITQRTFLIKDELGTLFHMLLLYWFNPRDPQLSVEVVESYFLTQYQCSNKWLAYEFGSLLLAIDSTTGHKKDIEALGKDLGTKPLLLFFVPREKWEEKLKLLRILNRSVGPKKSECRFIWCIDEEDDFIMPIIQEKKHDGWQDKYGKGHRLNMDKADYLSSLDKRLLMSFFSDWDTIYFNEVLLTKILPHLVGHPLVFTEDGKKVTVNRGSLYLELSQTDTDIILTPSKKVDPTAAYFCEQVGDALYSVIEITPRIAKVVEIIGEKGMVAPIEQKGELVKALQNIATELVILSRVEGVSFENVDTVEGSAELVLRLSPYQEGLELDVFISPLSNYEKNVVDDLFLLRPGIGNKQLINEDSQRKMVLMRNLDQEKAALEGLMKEVPCLQSTFDQVGHWLFPEPNDALELVDTIEQLGKYRIEWPKGEPFKISARSALKGFHLHVKSSNDWLEMKGEVTFDDGKVYSLKQILTLLASSRSRFIRMEGKQLLAISQDLKAKLEHLSGLSYEGKEELQASKLAVYALQDALGALESVEGDEAWGQLLEKAEKARKHKPELPKGLEAELRPYQVEGFQWLSRLAALGAGACLADDMGLGKTIQAITVLLERAKLGPALVICPVSIGDNWVNEITRFAPTLEPYQFRELKDGDNDLEKLCKPFHVILCSYGLMQQRIESFQNQQFSTIILDEAQAIKNYDTKRFKAVMSLKADFKILTTGTPIENHLMELWSLFSFINPGLLGSKAQFLEKFFNPIHRDKDKVANQYLRQMVQPFILRRLKRDVLQELPQKIEINRYVEMSEEEMNFYESLRQLGVENIESLDGKKGHKALQVLTEITKLRRACCHPDLIAPELKLPSVKLEEFDRIVDELLENGHKALVFSQFVGYLKIIEKHIEKRQIAYQYLDGETAPRKRQELVDKFQGGEGELFLISLKAGGSGLNLTAANYVIHMDPWWNPAVEDQATDRTHRIGQKQPVTVYRIITKGTIEEKIISLHSTKRELAEALLEGSEHSGKLDSEALFELLRSNRESF